MNAANASEDLPRFLRRKDWTPGWASIEPERTQPADALPWPSMLACVLLPFAAGYFLAYVFRTIPAVVAGPLVAAFDLSPATLGFMTAVYFLTALTQLPATLALERFGPRRTQAVLLLVAALGAFVFARADSVAMLVVGRLLIGCGVAMALLAALKAIELWVPHERAALASGALVMLGGLGAVSATLPAETLVASLGWRRLFEILCLACLASALLVYFAVPDEPRSAIAVSQRPAITLIFGERQFWRFALLSAAVVAPAWSLQGLWAAPWLEHVEGLSRTSVVWHLFAMAIALSVGALLLGAVAVAGRLRRAPVDAATMLAAMGALMIVAELMLIWRAPVPALLPWLVISVAGAATVISFTAIAEIYPGAWRGRANLALNLVHLGCAFLVQFGIGALVGLWPQHDGQPPLQAYQGALLAIAAVQGLAVMFSLTSGSRTCETNLAAHAVHAIAHRLGVPPASALPYWRARQAWTAHLAEANAQHRRWRIAAVMSLATAIGVAASQAGLAETSRNAPSRGADRAASI